MKKFSVHLILRARLTLEVEAEDAEDARATIGGDIPCIEYNEASETDMVAWEMSEIDVLDEDGKLDPISYNHFSNWSKESGGPKETPAASGGR